jgi:hypothetical protein
MTEEERDTLEKIGHATVKRLIATGMLVSHLIVPAHEWLDKKEADDATSER